MNKNFLYIGIALVGGLVLGWLIFGGREANDTHQNDEHTHEAASTEQMWTCSMHPQIMQPEPGDCPICGMDLIPAEAGADGLGVNEFKMTKNAMALADIQTTHVGSASVGEENMITLSGKIAMNEEENAVQASYFDGRIEKLNINYNGQEVRKGELLATIYAPSLVAAQQELITAASLKQSQPALYNAVRNKLKLWKLTDNQINRIERSGEVQENFPVYATVSGTVSEKLVAEGDYVKQGQPIVKVSNLNSVWAEFDVYENQIDQLKKGQRIAITSNAYPNTPFKAKISFIDPVLDAQTRTVTVRADLQNTDGQLKPGMFITGKIEGQGTATTSQFTIPATAVMWTGERSVVYLKTNVNEPIFKMHEVTLGNRNGDNYTVLNGLQNGDEIVTNGTFTVDAAAQLQGKRSMMNQDVEEQSAMEMQSMEMQFSTNTKQVFKQSLPSYLKLKDAFVNSDASAVIASAKTTLTALKSTPEATLGTMEKAHINTIKDKLVAISKTKDLEAQRGHFVVLNENMVAVIKNIIGLDVKLYIQKCPMANNNNGAVWLSTSSDIKNPYYGEAMLSCGSVIDVVE